MIATLFAAALLAQAGQPRGTIERPGGWRSDGPTGGFVSALVVDPSNPLTLYAGTLAGVFKTMDGGASWIAISAALPNDIQSLAVDPSNSSRVYFSTGSIGSHDYRSEDGGHTWVAMTQIAAQQFLVTTSVTALAVDPHASEVLYAGVTTGSYHQFPGFSDLLKSIDGGQSWTHIFGVSGQPATQILFDREDPAMIYAALAGGAFKSVDSGVTWNDVSPMSGLFVVSLAQSPSEPEVLFAATYSGAVFRSGDRGGTWEPASGGLPQGLVVSSIVSAAPSILYLGTDQGVFRSDDDGSSWHQQSSDSPQKLTVDPTTPSTVYSTGVAYTPHAYDGVSKSTDSAATWHPGNDGLNAQGTYAIAANPSTPGTVYAGAFHRVFKSTDGGRSWEEHELGGDGLLTYVVDFAFDPFDSETLYSAGTQGVFESHDGGDHWSLISASLTGLDQSMASVVADPLVRDRLFAGGELGKVFRTDDGGARWVSVTPPQSGGNNVYNGTLAFDSRSYTLYFGSYLGVFRTVDAGETWHRTSVEDRVAALEVAPDGAAVWAGSRQGLYRSTDAGMTWQAIEGLPIAPDGPYVYAIAINPVRSSEIYVSVYGLGVYRSTDGGQSWLPFNDGLLLGRLRAGGLGRLSIDASGDRLYGAGVGVYERPIGTTATRVVPPRP